jgi:hypothetical protein
VYFENPTGSVGAFPIQVVAQQAGEVTVVLSRSNTVDSLQIRVRPWSPVVGVNVDDVVQTITFANGQGEAAATVRFPPGAPNPGEVDVWLNVEPIVPSASIGGVAGSTTLNLRIVASDPTPPPEVVSAIASIHARPSRTTRTLAARPGRTRPVAMAWMPCANDGLFPGEAGRLTQ